MASLSSRASASASVSCTLTDVNKAGQQIFAPSSRTFEYLPTAKATLGEHIKERHTKRDMYGANPSSPSKCCLARAYGVGSNLKPAGYHSGTNYFKYSFFPYTTVVWNNLPYQLVNSPSVISFKAQVSKLQHIRE